MLASSWLDKVHDVSPVLLQVVCRPTQAYAPCLHPSGRVHAVIQVQGVPVTLLDTAGLREAPDAVERLGVQRAARAAADADIVALVFDAQVMSCHLLWRAGVRLDRCGHAQHACVRTFQPGLCVPN